MTLSKNPSLSVSENKHISFISFCMTAKLALFFSSLCNAFDSFRYGPQNKTKEPLCHQLLVPGMKILGILSQVGC